MAAKDRMKKRRQRIRRNGGKTLSVLIDQDTVSHLAYLKSHFNESQAALVARAINNLYAATRIPDSTQQPDLPIDNASPGAEQTPMETDSKPNSDDLLMKIIIGR